MSDLRDLVGRELGPTSWIDVTQERIDAFAAATEDPQWIHVDPQRAAAGPFGATIAHGFLTLSLCVPMLYEVLPAGGSMASTTARTASASRRRSRAGAGSAAASASRGRRRRPRTARDGVEATVEIEGAEQAGVRRRARRPDSLLNNTLAPSDMSATLGRRWDAGGHARFALRWLLRWSSSPPASSPRRRARFPSFKAIRARTLSRSSSARRAQSERRTP